MTKFKPSDLTKIALFTAVIVVLSQISIPMPYGVPMTLQTFIIPLTGILLGKKSGTISTILYILLGLIGLPVFAGFSGGVAIVFGPTGGFILSFPIMAYIAGWFAERNNKAFLYIGLFLGAVINFLVGFIVFHFVTGSSLSVAFAATVLPFIPTTIIKVVVIGLISQKLRPLVKNKVLV
ncbi:biotin transporter BioY [Vagococcus luciliae]|uniref:Biotin transporter n=1 Tax=Vagococcus luciliae TaxID=2920380 RepID=A0ABY5NZC6_9ENTE|nr:biotin transporter BioY [Vagococcus luciliae]UUV99016.1 Biotin transporter BioY [Vagococcus luciliae]